MKERQTKEFYDFGAFRLDLENRLLWRAGKTVPLTPKEFELLLILVENAGRVLSKDDLLNEIWADTFVEESTLSRNISWLRKKLGADSDGEKFIENIPKRGYRFLPAVKRHENAPVVVEEETLQHYRVEETLTIADGGLRIADLENAENLSPAQSQKLKLTDGSRNPQSAFRSPQLLWLAFGIVAIAAIGFAVYQIYFQSAEPKTILANRVRPFAGLAGREDMPAFSPDGKQMAFAWNGGEDGDNLDVYVKIIGAGEPVRLTDDKHDDTYPRFSPDNRFIAFVRKLKDGSGEVILISALGGAERRICRLFSGNYSISFSPDGQHLAVIDSIGGGGEFAIHTVNLQTGEKRRLTAPGEFTGETTPRFSPDGTSVAFVGIESDASQDLFVVPATGGAAQQLTVDGKTIHSLAWDSDGQSIIFTSLRVGNAASLWRIAAAGGEPELIAAGGSKMTNLTVSPDGKTIAFVETARTKASIWRVLPGDVPRKFIQSALANHSPQFSPDGKRIAFASDRTGVLEIWLTEADGRNQRQLTFAGRAADSPSFSPDGKLVAYAADNEYVTDNERGSNIFIVSTEVGELRRLTDATGKNFVPTWSVDGAWIYFCSNRTGDFQLWKIPAAGGEAVQITRHGGFEAQPGPDGKTIFYSKRNAAGLWRASTDGGAEELLPEFTAANFAGSWTMTRTGIYFFALRPDELLTIRFYDFTDGKIKDVPGDNKISNKVRGNLAAAPDGSQFLYAMVDENASSIMLAEID